MPVSQASEPRKGGASILPRSSIPDPGVGLGQLMIRFESFYYLFLLIVYRMSGKSGLLVNMWVLGLRRLAIIQVEIELAVLVVSLDYIRCD